jgi:serine/threonine-protein kinase RsbW
LTPARPGQFRHVQARWSVSATPEAVGRLRSAVGAFAAEAGVDDPPLADVRLAVTEAVTNVVVHGYREEVEPGVVDVDAEVDDDELHIRVVDHGKGMTPRPDSPGLGMGLAIIAALAQGFEVRERDVGGTELHMCFTL